MVMMYLEKTPAFPIIQAWLEAGHVEDLHANALVPLVAEVSPFLFFSCLEIGGGEAGGRTAMLQS